MNMTRHVKLFESFINEDENPFANFVKTGNLIRLDLENEEEIGLQILAFGLPGDWFSITVSKLSGQKGLKAVCIVTKAASSYADLLVFYSNLSLDNISDDDKTKMLLKRAGDYPIIRVRLNTLMHFSTPVEKLKGAELEKYNYMLKQNDDAKKAAEKADEINNKKEASATKLLTAVQELLFSSPKDQAIENIKAIMKVLRSVMPEIDKTLAYRVFLTEFFDNFPELNYIKK